MEWYHVALILFALFIVFMIFLIRYKNKIVAIKEDINLAKSSIRIAKAKYVQVMNKTLTMHDKASSVEGEYMESVTAGNGIKSVLGNLSMNPNYKDSMELIRRLADEYQKAQDRLNNLVNRYNREISLFPKTIFAKLLRYKKEEYIDNENLQLSSNLSDNIDEEDL